MPTTVINEIKQAFTERVKSPIIMSYIIANCTYHYDLVLQLMFSKQEIESKVNIISNGFETGWDFVNPILIMLTILFVIPFLNFYINKIKSQYVTTKELDLKADESEAQNHRDTRVEKSKVNLELSEMKNKLDKIKIEYSDKNTQLNELNNNLVTNKNQIESNKVTLNKLNLSISEKTKTCDLIDVDLNVRKHKLKDLTEESDKQSNTLNSINYQLTEMQKELNTLNTTKRKIESENHSFDLKLNDSTSRMLFSRNNKELIDDRFITEQEVMDEHYHNQKLAEQEAKYEFEADRKAAEEEAMTEHYHDQKLAEQEAKYEIEADRKAAEEEAMAEHYREQRLASE